MTAPWRFTVLLVCALAVASIWLATLQRIAFEREQAASAVMQSNANLAIAFEQQMFRTLKAAEQIAAFVREEYLRSGETFALHHRLRYPELATPPIWVSSELLTLGQLSR